MKLLDNICVGCGSSKNKLVKYLNVRDNPLFFCREPAPHRSVKQGQIISARAICIDQWVTKVRRARV